MLPIRWRLTIFHALAILGIAVVLLVLFFAAVQRGVVASVEDVAEARAAQTVKLLEIGPLPEGSALDQLAQGDVYIVIRDGQGRVLAQTADPTAGIGVFSADVRRAIWRGVLD